MSKTEDDKYYCKQCDRTYEDNECHHESSGQGTGHYEHWVWCPKGHLVY